MPIAISDWFEKVRAVPLVDVMYYLDLTLNPSPNGKNQVRSNCIFPDHPGRNKSGTSFSLDIVGNRWYCFGCHIGGGNIELVQRLKGIEVIDAANFIAQIAQLPSFQEIKASSPQVRKAYRKRLEEEKAIYQVFHVAAHYFHAKFIPKLRKSLLIPQGNFEPKDTWQNIYETWGMSDEMINENLIGFDDGNLLQALRKKGYSDEQIIKSGLFYLNEQDTIGDSIFKNRLTFPYFDQGRIINFIARSTEQTWPCYKTDPKKEQEKTGYPYAKYKKIPLRSQSKIYVSEYLVTPLFGRDQIICNQNIAMVEGVTDVILLREFFKLLHQAGIKEAGLWGVASFLSNQVTSNHLDILAKAAKKLDHLLLLCDNEQSGSGKQGALATAKKLLDKNVIALIGEIPLSADQEKIDAALWGKDLLPRIKKDPQKIWDQFLAIAKQSQNIVDLTIEAATKSLADMIAKKEASRSYISKQKRQHVKEFMDLIVLLPEIDQDDYLKALTEVPFGYKESNVKRLLKAKQGERIPIYQVSEAKPKEQNSEFVLPGVIPDGWEVNSTGMYREISTRSGEIKYIKIAEYPMLISEKHHDIDTGQYYLKGAFYENGQWKTRTESREIFMTSRQLPGLAKWGFPVNSENAKHLVSFLTEYEAANRETIKVSQVVSSCGNKIINGEKCFVLGRRCIFKTREEIIEFLTPDAGEKQIVEAFESYGDLEAWKEMARKCVPYPGVMLCLYTSFSNPYLRLLKSKGFTIHPWYHSTAGKSVTSYICASPWGNPEILVQSWNVKEVGLERRMALCNEVGVFLDDLKHATDKRIVERIFYGVTNGYGRIRGSLKGQQKTEHWLINLISNGEMPATQTSTDEGGQARVINIRGNLFGPGQKELVEHLESTAKENYGMAGPFFIQNADARKIVERCRHYKQKLSQIATTDIGRRIGNYLATILAIGDEVNRVFQISGQDAWEGVEGLVKDLLQDASTIDRANAALEQVVEWASANEGLFYPKADMKKEAAGLWKDGDSIGFYPYKLKEIVEKFGFNYDAVLRDWDDRGWLKRHKGNHKGYLCSINEKRIRLICFKWEILQLEAVD